MENNNNQPKSQNVTIVDIAEEVGVSYSTVSRVLNGFDAVKDSTRQRVLEAADRLGYVRNSQARSLAKGRTNVIGVLAQNIDKGYGYTGEILRGVDRELYRANYHLMMFTSRRYVEQEKVFVETIASSLTDGVILIAPLLPSNYIEYLHERKFPYVLLDQSDNTYSSPIVECTNWQGAYDATSHLIELGHRRIAFIEGLTNIQSAIDRHDGYRVALADNNLQYIPEIVVQGDFSHASGYQAAKQLLTLSKAPTAIFASNDVEAIGAIEAIRESGLRIPEDISIVGFDDIPIASIMFPKLTTVQQPLEQMGSISARLLLEQVENPQNPPRRITLSTQLIKRESTGPVHGGKGYG